VRDPKTVAELLDRIAGMVERDSIGWEDPGYAVEVIHDYLWTDKGERKPLPGGGR
jgi:hypothetical protein